MPSIRGIVEAKLSGDTTWTDLSRDVDRDGEVRYSRGIMSDRVDDVVEQTPRMNFLLNNSAGNSGGLQGYYTLGHANARAGWVRGIPVRAVVEVDPSTGDPCLVSSATDPGCTGGDQEATRIVDWTGELDDVVPDTGKHLERRARVECLGYTNHLAIHRLTDLGVLEGVSEAEAVQALYDAMPVQPPALVVHEGPDTYDYVFDRGGGGRLVPMTELAAIGKSSLRYDYSLGDGTKVNESRTVSRAKSGNSLTPAVALTEADLDKLDPPSVPNDREDAKNLVQLTMTPRRVDAAAVVVAKLARPIGVDPGETLTVILHYRDPDDLNELSGAIAPVAMQSTTDYTFNTESDGSGTDLTASVNITETEGATGVRVAMQNTASQRAWATLLRKRARGVYSQESITIEKRDASADTEGERSVVFNMPYQSEELAMDAAAAWILDKRKDVTKLAKRVPLLLLPSASARAITLLQQEPSAIFSMAETMSGHDGTERYHINGIEGRFGADRRVHRAWIPVPAFDGFETPFADDSDVKHLTTGGSAKAASSHQTKSVTAAANTLLTIAVNHGRDDSVTPTDLTSITGLGGTWVQVATLAFATSGVNRERVELYRAMLSAGATGKLTITFPENRARASWTLLERMNVNTGGTHGSAAVVQSATASGGGTSTTANLAAFADAENRCLGFGATIASHSLDPEIGHDLVGRRQVTPSIISTAKNDAQDTSVTIDMPSNPNTSGVIAIEVDVLP